MQSGLRKTKQAVTRESCLVTDELRDSPPVTHKQRFRKVLKHRHNGLVNSNGTRPYCPVGWPIELEIYGPPASS